VANKTAALDVDNLKKAELSDGTEVTVPKLTGRSIIRIAKTLSGGVFSLFTDEIDFDSMEVKDFAVLLMTNLDENVLSDVLSELLGIDEAIDVGFADLTRLITAFAEVNDLKEAFTQVRNLIGNFRGHLKPQK
jgi:hypothetical protein